MIRRCVGGPLDGQELATKGRFLEVAMFDRPKVVVDPDLPAVFQKGVYEARDALFIWKGVDR